MRSASDGCRVDHHADRAACRPGGPRRRRARRRRPGRCRRRPAAPGDRAGKRRRAGRDPCLGLVRGALRADPRGRHQAGLGGVRDAGRSAALHRGALQRRRAPARRPDRDRGGRGDPGGGERHAGGARPTSPLGSAVARAGDHRRHRGRQRQRPAAPCPWRPARFHHRRDGGAYRRPGSEGRRHRRQERRRLRSRPPADGLLRLPRRHPYRDLQAGAGAAGIADRGGGSRFPGGCGARRRRSRQFVVDADRDRD